MFLEFLVWGHDFQFLKYLSRISEVLHHSQQVVLMGTSTVFKITVGGWALYFGLKGPKRVPRVGK